MVLSSSCPKIVVLSSPASSTTVFHKDGLLLRLLLQTVAMVFYSSRWKIDGRHQGAVYLDQERACRGTYNRGRLLDCTNVDLKPSCLGVHTPFMVFGPSKNTKIKRQIWKPYILGFSRSIFVIVQIGMTATFHASPVFHWTFHWEHFSEHLCIHFLFNCLHTAWALHIFPTCSFSLP